MTKMCTKLFVFAAATMVLFSSCAKDSQSTSENNSNLEVKKGTYYGYAQISVPAATKSVFVEYNDVSKAGKVIEVPVTPVVAEPTDGKDAEPFGLVELLLKSDVPTKVSIYSNANQKSENVYSLTDFPVDQVSAVAAGSVKVLELAEPAPYITTAQDRTIYHSSGVVFFDDSWPYLPVGGSGSLDSDFNDVVIDYDVEARTVSDAVLESDGWREQVKAVIHLRAVGGSNPEKVGLILEGFDTKNVESIEQYVTLDSYDNPHGELPKWVNDNITSKSVHNESTALRPYIEMYDIRQLGLTVAGNKSGEYTYTNNGKSHKTVFNLTRGYWRQPDKTQYQSGIPLYNGKYYNTIPGYVNVAGGLITFTVIYNMKSRAKMTAEDSQKCLQNMIDAVNNTANQNFYIVTYNGTPVCVKGYTPAAKDMNKYKSLSNSHRSDLNADIPYYGKNGEIWAFKVPTLTRHSWEKLVFTNAYPKYANYIATHGEEDVDWYLHPDEKYLVCWW